MKSQAIIELYSNAKKIVIEADGTATAYDANGKSITLDLDSIADKEAKLLAAYKLNELRTERNRLISETDWWDMSDTPTMTTAQTTYRQALRDITKTYSSLDDVKWPTKPE